MKQKYFRRVNTLGSGMEVFGEWQVSGGRMGRAGAEGVSGAGYRGSLRVEVSASGSIEISRKGLFLSDPYGLLLINHQQAKMAF